jgi:hypothetical protein
MIKENQERKNHIPCCIYKERIKITERTTGGLMARTSFREQGKKKL